MIYGATLELKGFHSAVVYDRVNRSSEAVEKR